ncbi:MAG: YkgJ family cysteine cluster protein [Vampirovibrio sp.]|nr:YkgJ family cysteine cluster protein [Vampirovibrio sp.]
MNENAPQTLFDYHQQTLTTLDKQSAELHEANADEINCKKGCSSCCIDGFKIRYIEAAWLLNGFAQLPPAIAQQIMQQVQAKPDAIGKCPLLIDDACSLYQHRPALCRAYGVLVKVNDQVSTCDLNFNDAPDTDSLPDTYPVLDLHAYYEVLDDLSDRLWQSSNQTPLAAALQSDINSDVSKLPVFSIRSLFQAFFNITGSDLL